MLERLSKRGSREKTLPHWNDYGQATHEHALNRHSQVLVEGSMDPGWTNADGCFSRYFKGLEQKMVETCGRRILGVT